MADPSICPTCNNPKTSESSGSLTQWIVTCECDLLETESSQGLSVSVCKDCGKRTRKARPGSISQFIFQFGYCRCQFPGDIAGNETIEFSQSSMESVDEEELEVDRNAFPFQRYKPISCLGAGSEGAVYLARDRMLDKLVAVKTLHKLDQKQLVAFQQQAKALSKLEHKSLVKVLDFGVVDAMVPYMVMEYADGKTLDVLISELHALDYEMVLQIFIQVTDGLSFAHQNGFFHRDIKPANVLVTVENSSMHVRLIDPAVITTSAGGDLIGTPLYMSPDEAAGLPYDARSEVYSVGCMLFEALSGAPPFSGVTPLQTLRMHAEHEVPALSPKDERVPNKLVEIVMKALAKNASERFQSMAELRDALKDLRTDETDCDTTSGAHGAELQARSRSKVSAALAFGAFFIVVAALGLTIGYRLNLFKSDGISNWKPQEEPMSLNSAISDYGKDKWRPHTLQGNESRSSPGQSAEKTSDLPFDDLNLEEAIGNRRPQIKATRDTIAYTAPSISAENLREALIPYGQLKRLELEGVAVGEPTMQIDGATLAALDRLHGPEAAIFRRAVIRDSALEKLASYPNLAALQLLECKGISSSGLAAVSRSPSLTFLSMEGSELDDAVLKGLRGSRLSVVIVDRLKGEGISAAGLKHLAAMKNLTRVQILCPVAGMPGERAFYQSLRGLRVKSLALRRPDMKELDALSGASYLSFSIQDARLDEKNAEPLSHFTYENLLLLNCNLEPHVFKIISTSPIKTLELKNCSGTELSFDGLAQLKACKTLSELKIRENGRSGFGDAKSLNEDGIEQLRKQLNGVRVTFESTRS